MNLFQLIAISALALIIVVELTRGLRRPGFRGLRLVRLAVWLAAMAAIAWPRTTQEVAEMIGIGRGADVILYVFVLAFLGTTFYWYSRWVHLERQVTELVRHLAIQEAQRGTEVVGRTSGPS